MESPEAPQTPPLPVEQTPANTEETRTADFKQLITGVEVRSELGTKPKINVSTYGKEKLSVFDKELAEAKENDKPQVVAVVRCWNKSPEDMSAFVARIEKMKREMPELSAVFLSINKESESGITEESLRNVTTSTASIPIIPLSVENYTWTSGLNSAAAVLNEMCLAHDIDRKNIRVMNMSFDVDMEESETKKLHDQIAQNELIFTARKTSQCESPFPTSGGGEKIWKKFKAILRDPNSTDLTELSYVMRNTLNVIRLSDIVEMGGFNPLTNGNVRKFSPATPNPAYFYQYDREDVKVAVKGMEDTEFFMRLILKAMSKNEIGLIKSLRRSFDDPVLYEDKSWNNLNELKKIKKIGNEMRALSFILSGLAAKEYKPTGKQGELKVVGLTKGLYVPPVMQDFLLRK